MGDPRIVGAYVPSGQVISGATRAHGSLLGRVMIDMDVVLPSRTAIQEWRAFAARAPFHTLQVPIPTKYVSRPPEGGMHPDRLRTTEALTDGQTAFYEANRAAGTLAEDAAAQSSEITVDVDRVIEIGTWFELGLAAYQVTTSHIHAGRYVVGFQPRLRRALTAGEPIYCDTPHAYMHGDIPFPQETAINVARVSVTLTEQVEYGTFA